MYLAICIPKGDTRKKVYSHQKVRTSLHDRTLDSMFPVANPAQVESQEAPVQNPETPKTREIKESDCSLTSVKTLRQGLMNDKHQRTCLYFLPLYHANFRRVDRNLGETHLCGHRRSGTLFILDPTLYQLVPRESHCTCVRPPSLNSLSDRIYHHFSEELFYQLGLRRFGDISRLRLEPPPPLRSLVEIAVQVEETTDSPLSKVEIVQVCQSLLCPCH